MNAQLIEEIRKLNLKPGETYTVEVDGGTVELWWRSPVPGTVYRLVRFGPMEAPPPYQFDENDLAPGNLGDPDDIPGSSA